MPRIITFGELMLRLQPYNYERFVQCDHVEFTFGGGEANVAVSLANYGMDVAYVTKLPAHAIGQSAVNSLRRYGVDTSKIVRGGADQSYGIEVARLAGLPESVVSRAKKILRELEDESGRPAPTVVEDDQMSFAAMGEAEVIDALRRAQVDSLSPLEALNLLYELKQKLR